MEHKQELSQVLKALLERPVQKEEIVYHCGEDPGGRGFLATVTLHCCQGQVFQAPKPAHCKKQAEQLAASAAVMHFSQAAPMQQQGVKRSASEMDGVAPAAGTLIPLALEPQHPKQELGNAVRLILSRPVLKEDIVYEFAEADGGLGYVASVTIHALDGSPVFWSPVPAETKKQAEILAATAAVQHFKPLVAGLEEERKAKKAKKKQEEREEFRRKKKEAQGELAEYVGI